MSGCVYVFVVVDVSVRVCLNIVGEMAKGIISNGGPVEAGLQDEESVKQMDEFE